MDKSVSDTEINVLSTNNKTPPNYVFQRTKRTREEMADSRICVVRGSSCKQRVSLTVLSTVTGGDLCSEEVHHKSRYQDTMDYESSDDEGVLDLCKELGIRIPPKKKNDNITTRDNLENIDINNLPVVIIPNNTYVSSEVSVHKLSEFHNNVMMVETTAHSPMLPSNEEPIDINFAQTSVQTLH
ncbi:unnamed protein product [Parnassius apollo]|uniref:(apollo) hypothetical protein n=1 Tax=Parnassius apollo TaxID=110799 RepID=A0A8S3X1Z1_PARAO|nr:unnamed protein product [Parnassius apollo]